MSINIRTTTMLGSLSIGVWEARKTEKGFAREAEKKAKAKEGTLSGTKHLMAGVEKLDEIRKFATAVRVDWSKRTVPWFDNGPRAFNAALAVDYKMEMGEKRSKFLSLVDEFMEQYPTIRANRQFEMGDLFDPAEFPFPEKVRHKFYFSFEMTALPDTEDIRILNGVDESELKEIAKEAADRERERVADAVGHAARRLYEVVAAMHKTMATPIGEAGSKFNDSKLENIHVLVEIMPALNITNDPELVKLTKMAKKLATKSPDDLRNDEVKRAEAAKEAKTLADKLAGLFDEEGEE
jgi:hypothetical protein